MSSGIWLASATGLIGVVLGGLVSLAVSRQQIQEARKQRSDQALQERRRLSIDRRFNAYSAFIAGHRAVQYAVRSYYTRAADKPSLSDIQAALQSAYDSVAMVFLVAEAQRTYDACRGVLRALRQVERMARENEQPSNERLWQELKVEMGRTMREFQNAAREELEVNGPEWLWIEQR